jgi:hypothetical protein
VVRWAQETRLKADSGEDATQLGSQESMIDAIQLKLGVNMAAMLMRASRMKYVQAQAAKLAGMLPA